MDKFNTYVKSMSLKEREAFAKKCGTTWGYMRKVVRNGCGFGAHLCVRIAIESGGSVTCESMRGDIDWELHRTWAKTYPADCCNQKQTKAPLTTQRDDA